MLKAPPGQEYVRRADGSFVLRELQDAKEPTAMTISFRLPTEEYVRLMALKECFEKQTWADAMRWLVMEPRVQDVIRERLHTSSRPRANGKRHGSE